MNERSDALAAAAERLGAALLEHAGPLGLRLLRESDCARIAALLVQAAIERDPGASVDRERTRARLQAAEGRGPEVIGVMADAADEAVGVLWVRAAAGAPRPLFYIEEIALRSELRNRGYGSGLLRALEAAARKVDASGLALDYMVENSRVQALYTRLGYRAIGVDLSKPAERALVASSAIRVEPVTPAHDLRGLAARIARERTLSRFERPLPDAAEVEAEMRADLEQGAGFVATVDDEELAYVWSRWKRSRLSGAPIIEVAALGPGVGATGPRALALLARTDECARTTGHAGPMFVTLWEAAPELLQRLTASGFTARRYKLFNALPGRGAES